MNKYQDDIAFLSTCGIQGIELSDDTGHARILLAPAWQGRVMTSTATGPAGNSFGWLNRPLIASGSRKRQFNPVGGEERLWLGPEGGPYSLYFAHGASQVYENWQVPTALDTEPFPVVERQKRQVRFARSMTLLNAAGTRFEIGIDRIVRLLSRDEAAEALQMPLPDEAAVVAYRSENSLTNQGADAWTAESGAPSIWMLGMFEPTPSTTVFLPYAPTATGKVVNSNYFGEIPDDRLSVGDRLVCLRIDGCFRSKIGLPAGRDTGICGSYDASAKTLTLIRYKQSVPGARYVESRWGEQSDPFGGDVVNAYNDGPTDTGEVMGPFYEIETSSPAAFLQPGAGMCHIQEVFHIQGTTQALEQIADRLIPGGLRAVEHAFKS